ncbi:MAG: Rpn family recombination-promoting nuclease/putative transposase, partial [Prevotellaceae bacterium]|nr:Rpn family recombination-promoting nuclease/putative transposase [Prevotellaceae bacterium]
MFASFAQAEEDIRIIRMPESEDSEENASDKYWRIDMLAENSKGEQMLVEVRNDRELAYFHRMLYGVPKAITEYVKEEAYAQVKKLYLINIVYFDVGEGKDYVYRGRTKFTGLHNNDVLRLFGRQHEQFTCKGTGDLFTEYYILRVHTFDENVVTSLDEWMLYLKTCDIHDNATAKGLPEARERLRIDRMDKEERAAYNAHTEALRYQKSVIKTSLIEGRAKGREIAQADDPEGVRVAG